MSVLTQEDIKKCFNERDFSKRLIVTPLLNPSESIGCSSVEVRLGNQFVLMRRQSFTHLDIAENASNSQKSFEKYQQRVITKYKEPFVLHPHQLVISSTLEYISLPERLMAYIIGKSTWGRMGLIVATAFKIDPGFKGSITLEIINEGEVPILLYPGIFIAQLVLHEVTSSTKYNGKYDCPIGPEFPKFTPSKDWSFWTPKKST